MEIILLENIKHLGNLGDQVKVKSGYGRNYLIPQGKALLKTKENYVYFESLREELEKKLAERMSAAERLAQTITKLDTLTVAAHTNSEGSLYGSIGVKEIINALHEQGIEIAKDSIELPSGSFHELGEYEVTLNLHSEVTSTIRLIIAPS